MLLSTSKRVVLIMSAFITFCCAVPANAFGPKSQGLDLEEMMKNDPAYQNMSQQERDEITKLSEELKNPETIAKIERMVPDMEKAIADLGGEEALKSMSEEDFTNFITNFASDWEEKDKINQEAKKAPAPKPAVKQKPKPADVVTLSGKDLLQANINTIITHIDSLFAKVPAMPEFPGKIEFWAQQGIVTEWGTSATWNKVKKYVELLESKLKLIISTDKVTGKQRYLDYIYENESLRNHIQLLKVKLVDNESLIDVSTFGLTKQFGAKSKKAAQKTISCLGEAVEKLKIIDTINSAIEKHEPLAKEMREQEEKLRKAAEQEAKKKPTISQASQTSSGSAGGFTGGYQPSSYQEPYYPSYSDYSSPRSSSRSSRGHRSSQDTPKKTSNTSTGGGSKGGSQGKSAKPDEKKDDKKNKEFVPTEYQKQINQQVNTFEEAIDTIVETSEEQDLVKKIEDTQKTGIISAKTKDTLHEIANTVTDATNALSQLQASLTDRKPYQKMVTDAKKKIEPLFGTLNKIYQADIEIHEEKIKAAQDDAQVLWVELKKAKNTVDEVSRKQPAATPQEKQDAQNRVAATEAEWKKASATVIAADQALKDAVPKEITHVINSYKKLVHKTKQFAKPPKKAIKAGSTAQASVAQQATTAA